MKAAFLFLFSCMFFFANAQETVPHSIYDFKIPAQNGGTIDLAQYKGKKILIVNTPVDAYYSRHYAELEAVYKQYKDKVVIIGFLANDFLIEPGSKKSDFPVERDYKVTFPLAAKVMVRGETMAPIYKWLTEKKYNNLKDTEIKWDFQKYLINEKGELVAEFDPKIKANSPEILAAINNN